VFSVGADGTVTADGVAQIGGSTDLLYLSGKTGTHAYVSLGGSNTAADFFIGADTAIPLIFRTDATERMRIDSSGNVGIGVSSLVTGSSRRILQVSTGSDGGQIAFADSTTEAANPRIFATNKSDLKLASANSGSSTIQFITGTTTPAERMRILSTGGITFNGDTAQANALDDYEEGTWTLGLNTSNNDATISTVNTTGYYTKIGNLVTVNIYNAGSNITAAGTGTTQISGLPFTVANANGYYSAVTFAHTTLCTTQVEAYAAINQNYAVLLQAGTITSAVFATGNPKYMMMSLTYMTSQ